MQCKPARPLQDTNRIVNLIGGWADSNMKRRHDATTYSNTTLTQGLDGLHSISLHVGLPICTVPRETPRTPASISVQPGTSSFGSSSGSGGVARHRSEGLTTEDASIAHGLAMCSRRQSSPCDAHAQLQSYGTPLSLDEGGQVAGVIAEVPVGLCRAGSCKWVTHETSLLHTPSPNALGRAAVLQPGAPAVQPKGTNRCHAKILLSTHTASNTVKKVPARGHTVTATEN